MPVPIPSIIIQQREVSVGQKADNKPKVDKKTAHSITHHHEQHHNLLQTNHSNGYRVHLSSKKSGKKNPPALSDRRESKDLPFRICPVEPLEAASDDLTFLKISNNES